MASKQILEFNLGSEEQKTRWQEPSTSRTCSKICTFGKNKARTRNPLTQLVDLCLDASIRKAAIAADDSRIIGLA